MRFLRTRPGATLVELLLFVALLATIGIALLPLLFTASEDRWLQQTMAAVEQNGVQLLQTIGYHVRHSERIIEPTPGGRGAVLAMRTSSGATSPTIIGMGSGTIILIQRALRQTVSTSQVAVEELEFTNTSASESRPSVRVRFTLSRTIRLQAPRRYSQTFEASFSLFPDDVLRPEECWCPVPFCAGNVYTWRVCTEGTCETAQTELQCT